MLYRKVSLSSPHLREGCAGQDPRISSDGLLFGASQLQIPLIGFGTKDPAFLDLPEADCAAWHQPTLHLPEVHRFRIDDAVVHPLYGIVTIDGSVLEETLGHIPFHFPGYAQSDQEVTLPWEGIGGSFKEALHVMGAII
jgi:hypothetical protein